MQERARELRHNMTPTEKVLWHELRTDKLSGLHFRRQQIIDEYIVDFYCHAAALIIEIDGGIHEQQIEYDAERDAHLNSRGFKIMRFTNDEVMNSLPVCWKKFELLANPLIDPQIWEGNGDTSGEL